MFLPEFGVPLLILVTTLALGWCPSLIRLIEAWHSHEGAMFLFGIALTALVVGSHLSLRWLYASLQTRRKDLPMKWRWKWTLCGYGMFVCGFITIGSLMLGTHQLYWLSKSSDPIFADPIRERVYAFHDISDFQENAENAKWNKAKTRAAFLGLDGIRSNKLLYDEFDPVWVEKDSNTLAGVVLIPRHPLNSSRIRVAIIQPGTNTMRPLSELHEVLASFGIGNADSNGVASAP